MVKPLKLELKFPVDEFKRGLETIKTGLKKSKEHTKSMNIESKRLEGTLKKVGKAFGLIAGAATGAMGVLLATLPTLAPQFERIKLAFFRMGLDLGTKLAPAFDKIAEGLEKFADSDLFEKILDFIGEISLKFADWFGNIINNEDAWKALSDVVGRFISVLRKAWTLIEKVFNYISDFLTKTTGEDIFGTLIKNVEGLGIALLVVADALDSINLALEGKVGKIIEKFAGEGVGLNVATLQTLQGRIPGQAVIPKEIFPMMPGIRELAQAETIAKKAPAIKKTAITIYNQIENLRGIDDLEKVEDSQNESINNYLNITGNSM